MTTVIIVQHDRLKTEDIMEEVKFIGAYSSRMLAEAAVQRLRLQPGFGSYPDGFSIDEYEVDKDHWTEGFVMAQMRLRLAPIEFGAYKVGAQGRARIRLRMNEGGLKRSLAVSLSITDHV